MPPLAGRWASARRTTSTSQAGWAAGREDGPLAARARRPAGSAWSSSARRGAAPLGAARRNARTSATPPRAPAAGVGDGRARAVDARRVTRGEGHGRREVGGRAASQGTAARRTAGRRARRDHDLARRRVPHQQAADPRMAAEQAVAGPDRRGERLGQLALAASPAGKLALLASSSVTAAMLPWLPPPPEKRTNATAASHRSSASHTRSSANSSRRPGESRAMCGWPARRPVGVLHSYPAAPCRSGRIAAATRARRAATARRACRCSGTGLAAQPAARTTGRARLVKPQPAIAHPAAAYGSAGELPPSRRSPRSTCLPAWLPASYALRATDGR